MIVPYVKQGQRTSLAAKVALRGDSQDARSAGELNYQITRLILNYLPALPTYEDFNEVVGVLESCKHELYRRMVAPYEDSKKTVNGDIYP